ncbi:MAG: hypothetical protein LBO63_04030 [Oscillospiraceae bacterium]|jgi:hypothetical protein|nr:hypothetical protein [Oscillospiraceae bacterium]
MNKFGESIVPDENRIEQIITEGQRYMDSHVPQRTPRLVLLVQQLRYISPLLWVTQLLALVLLVINVSTRAVGVAAAREILFAAAPLISLFAVPELFKDICRDMSELENVCKNSGSRILTMRLIIVGGINISVLTLLTAVVSGSWGVSFAALILYALVPFNCLCILNLLAFRLFRIRSRSGAAALSVLSAAAVLYLPAQTGVLAKISERLWGGIFIATLLILIWQVLRILRAAKSQGVLLWNSK